MLQVIIFILVLSVLVFVHELGHFLFAKRAGILVREFAIGFGPKIFSRVKGETLYSIRALPLGGFVKMAGEDGENLEFKKDAFIYATLNEDKELNHIYLYEPDQDTQIAGRVITADLDKGLFIVLADAEGHEQSYSLDRQAFFHMDKKTQVQLAPLDRQFGSKTPGQKALAIVAGPVFNIILTLILFSIFVFRTGIDSQIRVEKVLPNGPASQVGLQWGDVIESVDTKQIRAVEFFRDRMILSKGNEVKLGILRAGQRITIPINPQKTKDGGYSIGVELLSIKKKATIGQAIVEGSQKTWDWSVRTVDALAKLVTLQLPFKTLGGPLMIGSATGKAAEAGIDSLIWFVALLSLNLGIFNLLPIPALDGSRLVFIGIEAIRGRPISPNREGIIHLIGFALLMLLMVAVTFNDIRRLFHI